MWLPPVMSVEEVERQRVPLPKPVRHVVEADRNADSSARLSGLCRRRRFVPVAAGAEQLSTLLVAYVRGPVTSAARQLSGLTYRQALMTGK